MTHQFLPHANSVCDDSKTLRTHYKFTLKADELDAACNFYSGCVRQHVRHSIEGFVKDKANVEVMQIRHTHQFGDLSQAVSL